MLVWYYWPSCSGIGSVSYTYPNDSQTEGVLRDMMGWDGIKIWKKRQMTQKDLDHVGVGGEREGCRSVLVIYDYCWISG